MTPEPASFESELSMDDFKARWLVKDWESSTDEEKANPAPLGSVDTRGLS